MERHVPVSLGCISGKPAGLSNSLVFVHGCAEPSARIPTRIGRPRDRAGPVGNSYGGEFLMNSRTSRALVIAVALNVLLAAALAFVWWRSHEKEAPVSCSSPQALEQAARTTPRDP